MKKRKRVMVCVTQQKSCARLIDAGVQILKTKAPDHALYVVHVVKDNWRYFGQLQEADAMDFLFEESKRVGAELAVLRATDIEGTLAAYIEKQDVQVVVMGASQEPTAQQDMIQRLRKLLKKPVAVMVVPLEGMATELGGEDEDAPETDAE